MIFVSFMLILLSACTVVIDKNSGLASTQYRGKEIMRHGYTHRSGVWVINPYTHLRMDVTIRVMVKEYIVNRYGRDRRGYMVYTTPCPPDRVEASRTHSGGFGEKVFAPSPTILMPENYVDIQTVFYDRSGTRFLGKSYELHVHDSGNGWGDDIWAELNKL